MPAPGRKLSIVLHLAFAIEAFAFMGLTVYTEILANSGHPFCFQSIFVISLPVSLFDFGSGLSVCGLNFDQSPIFAMEW